MKHNVMEHKRGADGAQGNRLAHERSPYLLQHAHNPVDWYPWGREAFDTARQENKPIFLSIGYSTCHWCHVMAHESFEDTGNRRADERRVCQREGRQGGAPGYRRRLHDRLPDDDRQRRMASDHSYDARRVSRSSRRRISQKRRGLDERECGNSFRKSRMRG